MRKKRILITNDDGVGSPTIWQLYEHLSKDFACTIVAPADERSAVSHAISLHRRIDVEELMRGGKPCGYQVWGTPADCVKIALCELLPEKPDLIISGVNNGANVGVSIFYSGTIAAAREGAIVGIPSLAVSVSAVVDGNVSYACCVAGQLAEHMVDDDALAGLVLNVNVPACPADTINGVKVVRQAPSYFDEWFEKASKSEAGRVSYMLKGDLIVHDALENHDVSTIEQGFVAVTPLMLDLTEHAHLDTVAHIVNKIDTSVVS